MVAARDLTKLYEVETKRINEAVKNNINKFPERFSFILNEEEWCFLRSKNPTIENKLPGKGHYRKYLPRVFIEQGVAMLATILKSKVAAETIIRIMDAFVLMKQYISSSLIEQRYINNLVLEDHNRVELLERSFRKLEENKEVNEIYFDGKIYDAYSKIIDIFNEAKHELIIIDRYIDKNKIYHSGNSINHIGYRKSSINILKDSSIKNTIVNDIENIINNKKI